MPPPWTSKVSPRCFHRRGERLDHAGQQRPGVAMPAGDGHDGSTKYPSCRLRRSPPLASTASTARSRARRACRARPRCARRRASRRAAAARACRSRAWSTPRTARGHRPRRALPDAIRRSIGVPRLGDVLGRARLDGRRQAAERRHVLLEVLVGGLGELADRNTPLRRARVDLVVDVRDVAHVSDVVGTVKTLQQAKQHVEHDHGPRIADMGEVVDVVQGHWSTRGSSRTKSRFSRVIVS